MAEYETPGAKARRERLERIWPTQKPTAKARTKTRKFVKPLDQPAEPIPDEVEVIDEQNQDATAGE